MILQFASRYFIAKKSTQAINIISWVSMIAIAVGAAALIIVLSVFNGFEDLVKSLYSSFYPALKVSPVEGKTILVPPDTLRQLHAVPGIKDIAEVLEEKAVLQYNNGGEVIAVLKGVQRNYRDVSGIAQRIVRGEYNTGRTDAPTAVVGVGVEAALGIDVKRSFIPLAIYMPDRHVRQFLSPEQALKRGQIYPVGAFAIQQDFDDHYVITNLDYLRSLLDLKPGEVSALEISLKIPEDMDAVKQRVQQLLGSRYQVQTRYEQNRSLYNVMEVEKWAVYAILSFILIIAAFNMIGSLSMLVIEKEKDITILKAMGMRNSGVRRIFLAEGMLIALVGAAIGIFIALALCLLQQHFGLIRIPGDSFVVQAYPVSMQGSDFILVSVTILVIALLASWYPALRASRQEVRLN
ncbi:ABC transporter permease [Compostibacter hankyongensis]|uniref:FtsX-like permease family protein n=1 Tax=Compostibacter hankyongensis TaxID=1007089 RepID=A0ABP8FG21_9BACT